MDSKQVRGIESADAQKKHRACDECRLRKLACSKEPDGCSRCRLEGITCYYSPQKRMGRPRKRRTDEEPAAAEKPRATKNKKSSSAPSEDKSEVQPAVQDEESLAWPFKSDLDFLNDAPPEWDADLIDLMQGPAPQGQDAMNPQFFLPYDAGLESDNFHLALNGGVDLLNEINFDEEPGTTDASLAKNISDSVQRYWQSHVLQDTSDHNPSVTTSGLSTDAKASPESAPANMESLSFESAMHSAHSPPATRSPPSATCTCPASLFLAIDSLSRLPADVYSSMRIARNATKVAHDVIQCPNCFGMPLDDLAYPPPIEAFQSQMYLATLVPTACNAYASILDAIDKQTTSAEKDGQKLWFSLQDVGGFWGALASESDCPSMNEFNNNDIEPRLWRTTMRAILRLDVYGFDDGGLPTGKHHVHFQPHGLRNVVNRMEERSVVRHMRLDRLAASGKLQANKGSVLHKDYEAIPHDQRQCIRMLEAARVALDNLTIA